MISVLIALYSIAGIINFMAYFPTIRDLWNGKSSANLGTYGIWTFTMLVTLLYALFVNGDMLFVLVVGLQLLGCITIFILRFRLKNRESK